jgi:hypothetical protein
MFVETTCGKLIPINQIKEICKAKKDALLCEAVTKDGTSYTVYRCEIETLQQRTSNCVAALPGCYLIEVPSDSDMHEWEGTQFPRSRIICWYVGEGGACSPLTLELDDPSYGEAYILLDDGTVVRPMDASWDDYAQFEKDMRENAAERLTKKQTGEAK